LRSGKNIEWFGVRHQSKTDGREGSKKGDGGKDQRVAWLVVDQTRLVVRRRAFFRRGEVQNYRGGEDGHSFGKVREMHAKKAGNAMARNGESR